MSFCHLLSDKKDAVSDADAVAAVDEEPPLTADGATWLEILAYRRVLTYALDVATEPVFVIDETVLRSMHFMLLDYDLSKAPGRYRSGEIFVPRRLATPLHPRRWARDDPVRPTLTQVGAMRTTQITDTERALHVAFGDTPVQMPPVFNGMIRDHLARRGKSLYVSRATGCLSPAARLEHT